MTMSAGRLDRSLTITRLGEIIGHTPLNEPIYGPPTEIKIRCRREDASDGEKFNAGQVSSFVMSRFLVRSSERTRTITPVDSFTHDGVSWNIHGIKEAKLGRFRFIEITAVRNTDAMAGAG